MSFHFLSLPLEIRRPIYRYSLPHSVEEYSPGSEDPSENPGIDEFTQLNIFSAKSMQTCPIRWCKGTCPGILFANRQVHEEACEVLYHENTFPIYVRHPRQPRLPLNESRADDDSFVLISWLHRSWSHPRNGRIPLTVLRNHKHLSQIRRLHVDLPKMRDLFAADMYMRTTTYASYHGLGAWIVRLREKGGKLSSEDEERMNYVQQMKAPIDEIAAIVRDLPRVDQLVIVFQSEGHELLFIEYVASGLINLRGIKRAQCLYAKSDLSTEVTRNRFRELRPIKLRNRMMAPRLLALKKDLESLLPPNPDLQVTGLSAEATSMLMMLKAMRERMLLTVELRSEFQDSQVDEVLPILTNIIRE